MDQKRGNSHGTGRGRNAGGKIAAVAAAVLVLALAAGGVAYWKYQQYLYRLNEEEIDRTLDIDVFYDGIYVDGISLGGLTADEARAQIGQQQQALVDAISVSVSIKGAATKFTAGDMIVSFDTEPVLEKAWETGRVGSRVNRYDYVKALPENPVQLTTSMTVDPSPLESRILSIADFYDAEASDASITKFNPDPDATIRFLYEPEVYGLSVDARTAWDQVRALVEARQWGRTVEVATTVIEPQILSSDLEEITQRISHFESTMKRDENREYNIRLACSRITGAVIMPGEEFSFNKTTGPRTEATGFRLAGIILHGLPDEGVAGGTCQVSGTLFNALVMADLEITKRHHHSYELLYLTRGRDATVDYPTGVDLRCVNNGDTPVYLVMYTTADRKVVAEVYGKPLEDGLTIDITVDTLEEKEPGDPIYVADSEVAVGAAPTVYPAHNYIKCQSYKVYKDADGNVVRKVPLILDVYKAIAQEIHVNPADMPGAATPTPLVTATPPPTTAPTTAPTAAPTAAPTDADD